MLLANTVQYSLMHDPLETVRAAAEAARAIPQREIRQEQSSGERGSIYLPEERITFQSELFLGILIQQSRRLLYTMVHCV